VNPPLVFAILCVFVDLKFTLMSQWERTAVSVIVVVGVMSAREKEKERERRRRRRVKNTTHKVCGTSQVDRNLNHVCTYSKYLCTDSLRIVQMSSRPKDSLSWHIRKEPPPPSLPPPHRLKNAICMILLFKVFIK